MAKVHGEPIRLQPEVALADVLLEHAVVRPGTDPQTLAPGGLGAPAPEVVDGALAEDVIPAGDEQRGNVGHGQRG